MKRSRRRVVVLGGGYGGIKAMEILAKHDGVEALLIDRNRFHYLQTESYNFIAAKLSLKDITLSLEELVRGLRPDFRFVRDEAVALEEGTLVGREGRYPFDYLILAAGSVTAMPPLFAGERLYGVKKLANALHLKHSFEELLLHHMAGEKRASRIVVIGGGSSGVEIAAEMQHYCNRSGLYRGIRVTVVADRFLAELDETSRRKARRILEEAGVEIVEKLVSGVEGSRLLFGEESLAFDFGVVATGISTGKFVRDLGLPLEGPFLKVDDYLRVNERIYAVGDCAALRDRRGRPLPPTAQTAEQSGVQAAKNILRTIEGKPLKRADLKIYGLAIALGGQFAIAVTPYGKIDGVLAHLGKRMIEKFYKIPLRLKSEPDPSGERRMISRCAVGIDLGSNTLRAVRRECATGRFVAEYERIVRTADGLSESGRIAPEATERIVEALREAEERIGFAGCALRAVTTEALRRAENAVEVLEEIERRTGVAFEVIDGSEEARLTLTAVRARMEALGERAGSFVLVDIGGGSTELVLVGGEAIRSRSFPLGIVTLSQEAGGDLRKLERLLESKLAPLRAFVRESEAQGIVPERFVATAGTPTTVAAMKLGMDYTAYDARRINGTRLERGELRHRLQKLLAMSRAERERVVGVGRDDLIAAGILIFEGIFDVTGFDECVVIDDGLREGVAIGLCDRLF